MWKQKKILGEGREKYGVKGAEERENQSKGKSFILPVIISNILTNKLQWAITPSWV